MKYIIALLLLASTANSSPYFRLIDPANPSMSAGFVFTDHLNATQGVTELALITHSTKDGSAVPVSWQRWLAPENWTPLQIGGGGSFKGQAEMNIGSSYNVAPQLYHFIIQAAGSPAAKLDHAFRSVQDTKLAFSLGPVWSNKVVENGVFLPIDKWQGSLGIFLGAAWRFK